MRIAYLTSRYPAASHTFIRREVDALRRAGLDIVTFSVRRPDPDELHAPADRAAHAGTGYLAPPTLIALGAAHAWALFGRPRAYLATLALAARHRPPGLRAMIWALFHFGEAALLARMLSRRGVDHLHVHFANSGATVGLLAARLADLPWSLTLHGISETDYPAGLLLPEKLRMAQFAACASWFMRAQAMRLSTPRVWRDLMVVRCGVDFSRLPARGIAERARARARIVCVGRLSPEKGQAGLIEAFAQVRAAGVAAELVLVGDGPDRQGLAAIVAECGLTQDVTFLGRLPEPETLATIASADILALPSLMEGLPVVLIEAMALGVPVVASQVAGIPELVIAGETGLLFAASDWRALADAIHRLLDDPALRTRLSSAAKDKVIAEYDIDKAAAVLAARFHNKRGDGREG